MCCTLVKMMTASAMLMVVAATAPEVAGQNWMSALGDPGMMLPNPSTQFTAWNFCNGAKAPAAFATNPSPRMADCSVASGGNAVTEAANDLGLGTDVPGFPPTNDVDLYARQKELYLGKLCSKTAEQGNWSAWSVMFKSGNMDTDQNICPCVVPHCGPKHAGSGFMSQPLMVHGWTNNNASGYFAGTYDVEPSWTPAEKTAVQNALTQYTEDWIRYRLLEINTSTSVAPPKPTPPTVLMNSSFAFTAWYRNASGRTVYYSAMRTSERYPWLMNYLRTNDVSGGYGGYPWNGAGIMFGPVPTETKISVTLRVIDGGHVQDQFYLPEISGCWKLDGSPCDGDILTDVTRYLCFILAPSVKARCSATHQQSCPPYHVRSSDSRTIYRNDTENFPYSCYYMHCYAPNDPNAPPGETCDPYSNPNPQELMQMLPCDEWGEHGFPTAAGQGWIGDTRLWHLDVGALGSRIFLGGKEPAAITPSTPSRDLLQNAGYPGVNRSWISFEIGPEQMDPSGSMVRWEIQDWDIQTQATLQI
eukprot:m.61408 g.61408  ORF g.61408 m.61408 type:complete len:530 (+) comp22977_c0_seq2:205-1794(+)